MNKIKSILNNNGITLIELLASITILGIILISFFSFFSQSIIFSLKVEDKLTAMNVAEIVLNDVRNNNANEVPREVNGKLYYPSITYPSSSDPSTTVIEGKLNLKRVNIKIFLNKNYNTNSKPVSEIYSYIKLGG
jgi:prepilin-type N-terminal cleavage/methylation domain-containing protein